MSHNLAIHNDQGNIKTGTEITIKQQQDAGRKQNAEGQQPEDGSDEPCPAGQRHAHHGHPLGPQIQGGGNEI